MAMKGWWIMFALVFIVCIVNAQIIDEEHLIRAKDFSGVLRSIDYLNFMLVKVENTGQFYIKTEIPDRLGINLTNIENLSLWTDTGILFKTISKILS